MELFLGFSIIGFVVVISIDIAQWRRKRAFRAKHFQMISER